MVSGEGRIAVEQLVLVSLKRTTIGTWVPLIRLVNGQKSVPSHGLLLAGVIYRLIIFLVAINLSLGTIRVPSTLPLFECISREIYTSPWRSLNASVGVKGNLT